MGIAAKAALPLRRGSGAGESFGDAPAVRTPRARNMIGVIPHRSPTVLALSAVGLRSASAARRERLALASANVAMDAIEQSIQLQRPPMGVPPVPPGTWLSCPERKDQEDFPGVVRLPPDRKIRESRDSYPRIRAQT
jgi:hypothetical protein